MRGSIRVQLLSAVALTALVGTGAHAQSSTQVAATEPSAQGQNLSQTPSVNDQPAQEDSGEVVVTGTRGSLENAERTKRTSDVLVDGISADDIGALPDTAISESLVRIPGLTSNDRESGFEQVSLRGLGPDLTQVTYNGRLFPATSLVDRRTNLGDLPTEGIQAAIIQKTSDAATIQGGLAGTIGLLSIRPLDTKRKGLTVVARGIYDNLSKKTAGAYDSKPYGFRGEATYVGRLTPNLGVALTYSYLKQFNSSPSVNLGVPATGAGLRADLDANGVPDRYAGQPGVRIGARNQERNAFIGMVQWNPTSSLHLALDGLYIRDGGGGRIQQFFAAGVQGGALAAVNLPRPTSFTIQNDLVTQFDGQATLYREILQNNTLRQKQAQIGFNAAFDNGGPIRAKLDASYARTSRADSNQQLTIENAAATQAAQRINVAFDYRDRDNILLRFQPLTANDYALSQISLTEVKGSDTIKAARLDFDAPLDTSVFSALEWGIRFAERTKFNSPDDTNYTFGSAAAPGTRPRLDTSYLDVAVNPFSSVPGALGGTTAGLFPLYNFDKLIALRTATGATFSNQASVDIGARSKIVETSYSMYAQANIKAGPVTGNVGLRYQVTDVAVGGFAGASEATKTPLNGGGSYHGFLPALNLKYALSPTVAARFAYYKTVSPPTFGQQKIGLTIDLSTITTATVVNQGNPDLKPFTGDNFDASLEWYPDRGTSLAVQSFSKYVKNFVVSQSFPNTPFTLPNGQVVNATLVTSVNDPNTIRFWGIEVIGRKDFDFLPGFLSNFGVSANYQRNWTNTNSTTVNGVGGVSTPVLPNSFTEKLYNAQLYYSTKTVDLRVAYRHYSHYLRLADNSYQIRPAGTLDLSGSVELFKGIRVVGIVQNVTNATTYQYYPDTRYPDSKAAIRNYIKDGRVITAGIRAQF